MIRFLRDLIAGEPALSLGLTAAALGAWVAVLVAGGEAVPLWLAIASPVSTSLGAWYTRQHVRPIGGA